MLFTKHNVERIRRAIVHDFEFEVMEEPEVVVTDLETGDDEFHVVDLDDLHCTCEDFEYNCGSGEYCKHIFFTTFKRVGLL